MYTEYLQTLAKISEHLDAVAKIGGDIPGKTMPTPYVQGSLEVVLDGEIVGYFDFEDDYVLYRERPIADRAKAAEESNRVTLERRDV